MKTITMILFCLPLLAFAREVIIDPYQLERYQSKQADEAKCAEHDRSMQRLACYGNLSDVKYEKEYPGRGSKEYSKKVYSVLTKEQGQVKIDALQALQEKARENVDYEDLQPGEITAGDFLREKWWIYEHVLGKDPERLYIRY